MLQALCSLCLPVQDRGAVLGDLEEKYREKSGISRREAYFWYSKEAIAVLLRVAPERLVAALPIPRIFVSTWRTTAMEWIQDLRVASRSVSRNWAFTLLCGLTLGLGVGANTAIFSVLQGVLLSPLPFPQSDRLVTVWAFTNGNRQIPLTVADFNDMNRRLTTLEQVQARWSNTASLVGEADAEEVSVAWVSPGYLEMLGIEPLLGRGLNSAEPDTVLRSHQLWKRRHGGDHAILGKSIQVGERSLQVVGILPSGSNPNLPTLDGVLEEHELWRPMPEEWLRSDDRVLAYLRVAGRLAEGASVEAAQTELDHFLGEIRPELKEGELRIIVRSALDDIVGAARPMLQILMGAVGFVLLIACFNVAHLLLVRNQKRQRELGIRAALGAGPRRVVRQVLLESLLLSSFAALLGMIFAIGGIRFLLSLPSVRLPRIESISVDSGAFFFALILALASTLLFGLAPAIRSSRLDLVQLCGSRANSPQHRGIGGGRFLIATEVALCLTLLAGTVLLLRSFQSLHQIRPGFDTESVLTLSVTASSRVVGGEPTRLFFQQLTEELASLPGVLAAGYSNRIPLGGGTYGGTFHTEELQSSDQDGIACGYRFVSPNYFTAMGTRLIAGRLFIRSDPEDVAIIDHKLAMETWPGQDPIGKRIQTGQLGRNGEWSQIVGVVEHMRHSNLQSDSRPTIFFPSFAIPVTGRNYFAIRSAGNPGDIVLPVQAALRRLDPQATMAKVRTISDLVDGALAPTQFALLVLGCFGLIALLLAAIGLYGVTSYLVGSRLREIGIRMALGATRKRILGLVMRQTALSMGLGLGAGIVISRLLTPLMAHLLYGISPTDATTFGSVALLLLLVGIAGTLIPARRALQVHPRSALESE